MIYKGYLDSRFDYLGHFSVKLSKEKLRSFISNSQSRHLQYARIPFCARERKIWQKINIYNRLVIWI